MKFEFVPVDELRRPLPQRAQLEGQALRPDHRRQPVDRRRRRERPLRQAQRLLRQRTTSRWTTSCRRRWSAIREWPKNTPNYWALPAMGDAIGWTYRKDWFARPEMQAEFKKKYGRDLAPPQDLGRAQADRRVLPGPRDRRQEGLRRLHLHRARLRRHHHGRDQRRSTTGASSTTIPKKPYQMEGFVNSPDAVKGLEFYKALYKCCTAPGHEQRLHVRRPRRLQVRARSRCR